MKKLNNTEINALAEKIKSDAYKAPDKSIYPKVKKEVEKLWDKFKKSADCKILEKYKAELKLSMVVSEFEDGDFIFRPSNYKNGSYCSYYDSINTKGGTLYVYLKNSGKNPSHEDIKRELVLAQIEATDLDSLIEKVKKSLKLQ